jgi:hypothetical protein
MAQQQPPNISAFQLAKAQFTGSNLLQLPPQVVSCPADKPICFRKKSDRKTTSNVKCDGTPLLLSPRLQEVYNAESTKTPELNQCIQLNPTVPEDCFCNTFDYAWINYVQEALRRYELLKQSNGVASSNPFKQNNPILPVASSSTVPPFDFVDLTRRIIDIATQRWQSNPEKGKPLIEKLNRIHAYLIQLTKIGKEAESVNVTSSQNAPVPNIDLNGLATLVPNDQNKQANLNEIDNFQKQLQINSQEEVVNSSKTSLQTVYNIVDKLFSIALFILNPLENATVMINDITTLDNTLTNLFQKSSETTDAINKSLGNSVTGGKRCSRKNKFSILKGGVSKDDKAFYLNEYRCYYNTTEGVESKELSGLSSNALWVVNYEPDIKTFFRYILNKHRIGLLTLNASALSFLQIGKKMATVESQLVMGASIVPFGFLLSGITYIINKVILAVITGNGKQRQPPDPNYNCHKHDRVIFQDESNKDAARELNNTFRLRDYNYSKADGATFNEQLILYTLIIPIKVPRTSIPQNIIDTAYTFYVQKQLYDRAMTSMWYFIFSTLMSLSKEFGGVSIVYKYLTEGFEQRWTNIILPALNKFQLNENYVKNTLINKNCNKMYLQEQINTFKQAFTVVKEKFLLFKKLAVFKNNTTYLGVGGKRTKRRIYKKRS